MNRSDRRKMFFATAVCYWIPFDIVTVSQSTGPTRNLNPKGGRGLIEF